MSRYSGRSRLSNRGYALNSKPQTTLLTLFYSQVIETMVRPAGIEPATYGFEVTAERSRSTGKRHKSRRYTGIRVKIEARFPQPCNLGATRIPGYPHWLIPSPHKGKDGEDGRRLGRNLSARGL